MSSNVEKIKERLGIVDVVGNYVKLQKAGSNFKAKCPFHNEKTPSFFVSPTRESYYCFGCGAKGDIFTFTQEIEGLDFLGALKVLALRAGVDLDFSSKREKDETEKLFELMETATKFFEKKIEKETLVKEYLKKRGVKEETISEWRIGYASDNWRDFFDYAKQIGFSEDQLIKVGLIKKTEGKEGFYDVFRGRIVFPIFDSAGRVVAFSGRSFPEKENAPKYLNSPETILFNKSDILYGFDRAKSEIRKKNYSILVEGQMDLVISHQAGFQNTIATSGTALTLNQLKRLSRLSERIIFAYDGDSAGFKATHRSAKMALSVGMNVKIASLPKGEDPASLVMKDSERYFEIIKNSKHIIEFFLDKILDSGMDKRRIDQEVKKKILPYLKILPSSIDQSRWVAVVSERLGLKEEAVWDDLKKLPKDDEFQEEYQAGDVNKLVSRESHIIRRLSGIVFWLESLGEKNKVKNVLEKISQISDEKESVSLIAKNESEKSQLIFEAETYYAGLENLDEAIDDLINNFEEEILKEKFSLAMSELALAEKEKNKVLIEKILIKCRELSGKIENLKFKVKK